MITFDQSGAADVVRTLDALPGRIQTELRPSVARLSGDLAEAVKARTGARSGRLRASIIEATGDDGATAFATVASDLAYARAQEFGFHGTVSVRAHLRQIRTAFGRAIVPRTAPVRAHPMRMNLPERSFLRAALRDLDERGAIRSAIAGAIARSIA